MVDLHELSRADARRIAVRAQLLDSPKRSDLLDVVRRLTLLQNDSTQAVAPSAELVAWSRIGSRLPRTALADALEERTLIEVQGLIRPAEDVALYRAEMSGWPGVGDVPDWKVNVDNWVKDNDGFRRDLLAQLDERGPLTAKEIPDTSVRPWRSSGWNNNRNVTMMIEMLSLRGEVALAGRRGRDRLWDLAERIYPGGAAVPAEQAARVRDMRRLRSLGIARAKGPEFPNEPVGVGAVGESAVIDGVAGSWRVDPEQLAQPFTAFRGRVALLSPLDRLIFDRKRMEDLFEFDYQLEMYKPAAKRRWGYWAMPVLYGDRLLGKVDAATDRRSGVLRVNAIHEDVPFSPAMSAAVHREISALATWLALEVRFAE